MRLPLSAVKKSNVFYFTYLPQPYTETHQSEVMHRDEMDLGRLLALNFKTLDIPLTLMFQL